MLRSSGAPAAASTEGESVLKMLETSTKTMPDRARISVLTKTVSANWIRKLENRRRLSVGLAERR